MVVLFHCIAGLCLRKSCRATGCTARNAKDGFEIQGRAQHHESCGHLACDGTAELRTVGAFINAFVATRDLSVSWSPVSPSSHRRAARSCGAAAPVARYVNASLTAAKRARGRMHHDVCRFHHSRHLFWANPCARTQRMGQPTDDGFPSPQWASSRAASGSIRGRGRIGRIRQGRARLL
jgi:hypothetical protein